MIEIKFFARLLNIKLKKRLRVLIFLKWKKNEWRTQLEVQS